MAPLRYLLLQVRNRTDPMRRHEVECFVRALGCQERDVQVRDILAGWPAERALTAADVVLLGGSGEYSAAGEGEWLERILDGLRRLCDTPKPVFASCWGFQAIARALGGRCIHDPNHSELGNVELRLTEEAKDDPLFGRLPHSFLAHAGHEDCVSELPPGAVLLASTERVRNQGFRLAGKAVYCTQFHPELDRAGLLRRVEAYPQYVEINSGVPFGQFEAELRETPEANSLLRRFVEMVRE